MRVILLFLAAFLLATLAVNLDRRRRRRFLNPDNALPAFGPEKAHAFHSTADLPKVCFVCGGGANHSVHHGRDYRPAPPPAA